jgi:hypothetical protein
MVYGQQLWSIQKSEEKLFNYASGSDLTSSFSNRKSSETSLQRSCNAMLGWFN